MFNPEKPVQTRDGRKARIICTDAKGDSPILALIECDQYKDECPWLFMKSGRLYEDEEDETDLINIEEGEG